MIFTDEQNERKRIHVLSVQKVPQVDLWAIQILMDTGVLSSLAVELSTLENVVTPDLEDLIDYGKLFFFL